MNMLIGNLMNKPVSPAAHPAGRSRRFSARLANALAGLIALAPLFCHAQADAGAAAFSLRPAAQSANATRSMILDATRAGDRLVAVGERGVVLLSDDGGKQWRQAASVPVAATLTGVSFADAKQGWAVGHWGVVLHTSDGGENWSRQRLDTGEDRPLFSVHFLDASHGIAVGLWSLMLETRDGGQNWDEVTLPAPPGESQADANLMRIFGGPQGVLYVAGERGTLLRSANGGQSWDYRPTGYRGSFWSGLALEDGSVLLAGLRGNVYRSGDEGAHWSKVEGTPFSSITDLVLAGGKVVAVGLDGVTLESSDQGRSFQASQREDRLSLTAAVATGSGKVAVFSRGGVLPPQ